MATAMATKRTVTKATPAPRRGRPKAKQTFNNESDWYVIPSKQQLFMLSIAAHEGATFPGSEVLKSRINAKELIGQLKEQGFLAQK